MKITYRSSFAILFCTLFLASSTYGSEKTIAHKVGKHLNQIARIGSAISIGYWLPDTINAIERFGLLNATRATYTLRLGIDAACIAASHNKDSIALNIIALLGSAASLAFWTPVALAYPDLIMLSRIGLDATQIGLCAQRLYRIHNKNQEKN